MKSAANVIKRIRFTLGLGQAELAKKIGVTQQSICSYETGIRKPSYATLTKIKKLSQENDIEFSIDDFLD